MEELKMHLPLTTTNGALECSISASFLKRKFFN